MVDAAAERTRSAPERARGLTRRNQREWIAAAFRLRRHLAIAVRRQRARRRARQSVPAHGRGRRSMHPASRPAESDVLRDGRSERPLHRQRLVARCRVLARARAVEKRDGLVLARAAREPERQRSATRPHVCAGSRARSVRRRAHERVLREPVRRSHAVVAPDAGHAWWHRGRISWRATVIRGASSARCAKARHSRRMRCSFTDSRIEKEP